MILQCPEALSSLQIGLDIHTITKHILILVSRNIYVLLVCFCFCFLLLFFFSFEHTHGHVHTHAQKSTRLFSSSLAHTHTTIGALSISIVPAHTSLTRATQQSMAKSFRPKSAV